MTAIIVSIVFVAGLGISVWLWAVEGFASFSVMLILTVLVSGFVGFVFEIAAAIARWVRRL